MKSFHLTLWIPCVRLSARFDNKLVTNLALSKVLARPYLITLYVILPIDLNFPIRSRRVLKAIIHRKKQWIALQLLEKVLFEKDAFYDIVKACGIWSIFTFYQPVPTFHVSLSMIYLLFLPYRVVYTRFFLNTWKGFSLWKFSFNV